MTIILGLIFGLIQGLRHAFEPDHVIAVSTMISEQRTMRARIVYATSWGVGHAAMLILVGATLMLLRSSPPRLEAGFELAVSVMLIALGVRALTHAVFEKRRGDHDRDRDRDRDHDHGGAIEAEPRRVRKWRSIGPLAMGVVHGLAGSGALTALVVARLPSPAAGIAFMTLFGIGATLGMALLAGVAGVPLARLLQQKWGMPALLGATGALSLCLGLSWIGPAIARVAA